MPQSNEKTAHFPGLPAQLLESAKCIIGLQAHISAKRYIHCSKREDIQWLDAFCFQVVPGKRGGHPRPKACCIGVAHAIVLPNAFFHQLAVGTGEPEQQEVLAAALDIFTCYLF